MVFDDCCINNEVILNVLKRMNQPSLLQSLHIEQTGAEVVKETGGNDAESLLNDNRYVSHKTLA